MTYKISDDLSVITTIQKSTIGRLFDIEKTIVVQDALESYLNGEEYAEINIGIGTLLVQTTSETIKYKFIPCSDLEDLMVAAITTKESPLLKQIENNIKDRVENTYKNLL